MYDLALFQDYLGHKIIEKITDQDIANFLALATNKSTRKRRLTSIGGLFRFLIKDEKVLTIDPSDKFYPDFIPLKTPQVLFVAEQEKMLDAAQAENSRTYMIVWFLLRLGLTRAELLALKVDHVDLSDPEHPVVYVFYDDVRWQRKERKLAATPAFVDAYRKFLADYKPERRLFDIMPQSVNKLVDRVAAAADIHKRVTPQSLRDTYAVEHAREGDGETRLLQILGLAPIAVIAAACSATLSWRNRRCRAVSFPLSAFRFPRFRMWELIASLLP